MFMCVVELDVTGKNAQAEQSVSIKSAKPKARVRRYEKEENWV